MWRPWSWNAHSWTDYGSLWWLVFLYKNGSITLWNLATKNLERWSQNAEQVFHAIFHSHIGFGLNPVKNIDYELVLIRTLWNLKQSRMLYSSHVAIYNLSTNSWTDVQGDAIIHYPAKDSFASTYLLRVYYWLAFRDKEHHMILSFNMDDEVFQEIQGPYLNNSSCGSLAIFRNPHLFYF